MKNSLSILTTLLVILTLTTISVTASTSPEYLGFQLPQPETIPKFERRQPIAMYQIFRDIRLILSIDHKGNVTAVVPETEADSAYAGYSEAYLKTWRWHPAEFNGNKVDSRIMISAFFRAGYSAPNISYPGDSLTFDVSSDLKFESFRLNGIEPPRLIEFPSLSILVNKRDTSTFCAFVAFNLKLDSSGRVISSYPIRTNAPQYLPKLSAALLWANIEPARVNGRAVKSDIIVALTINRNLSYPTVAWESCCLDQLNLVQRQSVRLLLDTAGYIIPPIPRLPPGDSLSFGRGYQMTSDQIFCRVEMKPSGKYSSNWINHSGTSRQVARLVQYVRRAIRFFPAIDSDGNPTAFDGYAIIHRLNSRTIRIEYSWLNDGRLSSPADKLKQNNEIR